MSWTTELRQAFAALRAGAPARVSFAGRDDRVGEVGREFNRLADALAQSRSLGSPDGFSREQAHALRNRLAGLLAALHVLRVTSELAPEEEETLAHVVEDAKQLDAQLRAR